MALFRNLPLLAPVGRFVERPPLVTVLRLAGTIGGGGVRRGMTLDGLQHAIARAFAPRGLAAVALVINSPGGAAAQSFLIHERIRAAAAEKNVRVLAFVEDAAASGGYVLALAADEIYANPASIVGSIGVMSGGFGFPALLEKLGVERRVYTSAPKKSMLDPFVAEREEDVAYLAAMQKLIHEEFAGLVRARRGPRLKGEERDLFSGAFWSGREAERMGLIDGFGEVHAMLKVRFGRKVRIRAVRTERGPRWLRSIAGSPESLAGDIADALAVRAVWSRLGL